jgi:hypothetical protein
LLQKERLDIMSTEGYRPPSKTEAELAAILRDALDSAPGPQNETFHARFDHPERGISLDDVIHGLMRPWHYERPPEFNEKEWQWKYRLATVNIEGEPLTIIIAVDTANRRFDVITRW